VHLPFLACRIFDRKSLMERYKNALPPSQAIKSKKMVRFICEAVA
jgi:hypothetical protein